MGWRLATVVAAIGIAAADGTGAAAAVWNATSANVATVWRQVQPGDTLVLGGSFAETTLRSRNFGTAGLVIDASAASFPDALTLRDVTNVRIVGGSFGNSGYATRTGNAIGIYNSVGVSVTGATVLGSNTGKGVYVNYGSKIAVTGSSFSSPRIGITMMQVVDSLVWGNDIFGSSGDGINIVGSQRVTVGFNRCTAFTVLDGLHPDCLQLWSLTGQLMQGNIVVTGNQAVGSMQGFSSFDPKTASGTGLTFSNNYAEVNYPHGVACYGCFNSLFTGNTLVTAADARWRTNLNIVNGANNASSNNVFIDLRTGIAWTTPAWAVDPTPVLTVADGDVAPTLATFALPVTSGGMAGGEAMVMADAVPEPAVWLELVLGAGILGAEWRRQRRGRVTKACGTVDSAASRRRRFL